MAEIQLYWYPGTCARIPFVALEEIGAPFDVVVVDRSTGSRVNDTAAPCPGAWCRPSAWATR